MTTYRVCLCFWRRFLPATSEPPEAIGKLFRQYSENGTTMGAEQLQRFLVEVQGEASAAAREAAQAIVDGHRGEFLRKKKGLSLDAFFQLVFSADNAALSPTSGVHQDMGAPLSHYFIYTGHNSYLTGNQISSACSDVPIIKSLERGVRVIELDLWPNSTKDGVEVLHGRTLTTPVELIKCLRSIKEHAFSTSPYPVIITLEDHLTPDLQAKVAEMITEVFGTMLLFTPKSEFLNEFPSPEALKRRIIISTKPPKEYLESKTIKDKGHEQEKEHIEEAWGSELYDPTAEVDTVKKLRDEHNEHFQEEQDADDGDLKVQQKPSPEYKRLIAIPTKKRKGGMNETLTVDAHKVTRLSLGEQAFEKAIITHRTELIRFTQRNLLRIYPKASRLTSSNYNPLLGWMHGAQMVALNMQGYGRSLWLMHGMFRANGGCGYVKKPDFLLKNDHVFDPNANLPIKKTLKVTVYMGDGWRFDFRHTHFDTYSPPDFYTRVGIAGVPADSIMKRTKAIEDNWTPVWDEEFVFHLKVPELALLRIEVHEYDMSEKDDFGGQTCLPVSELRPGVRSVPLFDRKGDGYKSVKLLMRFDFI